MTFNLPFPPQPSANGYVLDFATEVCQDSVVGITARQFETLQARLSTGKPVPRPIAESDLADPRPEILSVLGVDPSLRGTGFGVVRRTRAGLEAMAFDTIKCPATWARSRCLAEIAGRLKAVVQQWSPNVCVVEGLFYAQNLKTALIMGEARGAALVALAESGRDIYEIAPRKAKQAIVGYGAAQKLAVAKMVQRMLKLAEAPAPDAADALALALAHLQEQSRYSFQAPKRI